MASMEEICQAQRAHGFASVLAIGTANPINCVSQADYPDYYFRITKSEKTTIKKRYFHLNEEILKEHPNIGTFMAPSLNARQDIVNKEIPKLGHEAAIKAIKEWGQPKSKNLIFCTSRAIQMPGADHQLAKLLNLSPSVNRLMFYALGCYGSGTVLRVAKDIAENNAGARILVVCSEIAVFGFHGPNENELGCLVGQAIFGDGAGAVIVGADPDLSIERPIFQIVTAKQRTIPDSEDKIVGHIREMGLFVDLKADIPQVISSNIEESLSEVFNPIGFKDNWNSLFWIVHGGGRAILDRVEEKLGLDKEKFDATRYILAEYGNMGSACALFVLDEMRKRSLKEGKTTSGDGLESGVLLGFGPGLTIETLVLRSVPINEFL